MSKNCVTYAGCLDMRDFIGKRSTSRILNGFPTHERRLGVVRAPVAIAKSTNC